MKNISEKKYLKDFDLFYRTDSSLNSFGNFLVYDSILKQMNISPFPIDCFRIRTYSYDFYGNLYSENFDGFIKSDTIDRFEIVQDLDFFSEYCNEINRLKLTQIDGDLNFNERNSIFDVGKLYGREKNKFFFGDSFPIKIVETNLKDAENILIFSDGSVDGLMQFLVLHFKKLIVIDLKQIDLNYANLHYFLNYFNIKSDIKNFEKVLFIYGIESLAKSNVFKRLSCFY